MVIKNKDVDINALKKVFEEQSKKVAFKLFLNWEHFKGIVNMDDEDWKHWFIDEFYDKLDSTKIYLKGSPVKKIS